TCLSFATRSRRIARKRLQVFRCGLNPGRYRCAPRNLTKFSTIFTRELMGHGSRLRTDDLTKQLEHGDGCNSHQGYDDHVLDHTLTALALMCFHASLLCEKALVWTFP